MGRKAKDLKGIPDVENEVTVVAMPTPSSSKYSPSPPCSLSIAALYILDYHISPSLPHTLSINTTHLPSLPHTLFTTLLYTLCTIHHHPILSITALNTPSPLHSPSLPIYSPSPPHTHHTHALYTPRPHTLSITTPYTLRHHPITLRHHPIHSPSLPHTLHHCPVHIPSSPCTLSIMAPYTLHHHLLLSIIVIIISYS